MPSICWRLARSQGAKDCRSRWQEWGKLVAGHQSENAYVVSDSIEVNLRSAQVRTWPEFAALRDIMFFWKYFLCRLLQKEG